MKQTSNQVTALNLPTPARDELPDTFKSYFDKCDEKLGLVPNVLTAYSQNISQLEVFSRFYNELMFGESELTPLEKEMIAVVVSCQNHCYYCLSAHGAAVREYSGDPVLGELLVMNYRAADLNERHKAMLDFACKLTRAPDTIEEPDRQTLRDAGFSDQGIWDIANIAGFYNMTNRVASAVEMQPNAAYHASFRE